MSLSPPQWTLDQLQEGAAVAIQNFRNERLNEEPDDYVSHFQEARSAIEDLLELTLDLTTLRTTGGQALAAYPEAMRYVAAPPISSDDLETLSEVPSRLFTTDVYWPTVVSTIMSVVDRQRFPWLLDGRAPTEAEREAAITATASQIASSRILTARRLEAKKLQEGLVKQRLIDAGFEEVDAGNIRTARDFPEPGTLCGESRIKDSKADVVIGLWDDRILGIECKVSNSMINSYKRINHEAAGKARKWIRDFGQESIVASAVIAGVFRPQNLLSAQDDGLTIWWSHDIEQMIQWIEETKHRRYGVGRLTTG